MNKLLLLPSPKAKLCFMFYKTIQNVLTSEIQSKSETAVPMTQIYAVKISMFRPSRNQFSPP